MRHGAVVAATVDDVRDIIVREQPARQGLVHPDFIEGGFRLSAELGIRCHSRASL